VTLIYATYAAVVLTTLLVVVCLRHNWAVPLAALSYAITMVLAFVLILATIGKPRPFHWDYGAQEGRLVRVYTVEDVGIYLLVAWDGETIPTYYALPWNLETAKQVRDTLNRSRKRGLPAQVERKRDDSLHVSEPPIKANPLKDSP
jgi:hypothetical protein